MKVALDAFPPQLPEVLGYTDISSPVGFVGSTTFGLLEPALIIVFAAAIGGSAIAGEEEAGRLDLTLAQPVSRWSIALQRFATIVVGMLLVGAVLGLARVAISRPAQFGDWAAARNA